MTEQQVGFPAGGALDGNGVDAVDEVVTRASAAVGACHGTTLEVAYAMLSGLAGSQGRDLQEYAARVLAAGGRLDV